MVRSFPTEANTKGLLLIFMHIGISRWALSCSSTASIHGQEIRKSTEQAPSITRWSRRLKLLLGLATNQGNPLSQHVAKTRIVLRVNTVTKALSRQLGLTSVSQARNVMKPVAGTMSVAPTSRVTASRSGNVVSWEQSSSAISALKTRNAHPASAKKIDVCVRVTATVPMGKPVIPQSGKPTIARARVRPLGPVVLKTANVLRTSVNKTNACVRGTVTVRMGKPAIPPSGRRTIARVRIRPWGPVVRRIANAPRVSVNKTNACVRGTATVRTGKPAIPQSGRRTIARVRVRPWGRAVPRIVNVPQTSVNRTSVYVSQTAIVPMGKPAIRLLGRRTIVRVRVRPWGSVVPRIVNVPQTSANRTSVYVNQTAIVPMGKAAIRPLGRQTIVRVRVRPWGPAVRRTANVPRINVNKVNVCVSRTTIVRDRRNVKHL